MKCQICGKEVKHLTPRDQIGMCPECTVAWDLCRGAQTGFWEDSSDALAERIMAHLEQMFFQSIGNRNIL